MVISNRKIQSLIAEEDNQYILFTLNDITYGTKLLSVREIVKHQEIKEVPNTKEFFLGVINLRGQVVGVVDLKLRFSLPARSILHPQLLVFETEKGPIAIQVDGISKVTRINHDTIDPDPPVHRKSPALISKALPSLKKVSLTLSTCAGLSRTTKSYRIGKPA